MFSGSFFFVFQHTIYKKNNESEYSIMRCIICGTTLEDNEEFCHECGARQNSGSEKTSTSSETKEETKTEEKNANSNSDSNAGTKICPVCGEKMSADTRFCPRCGKGMNGQENTTNIVYTAQVVPVNTVHYSGMAIAGFILSFFFPILGLIFSCVGLNQCTAHGKKGKGLAVAGLVLNLLWFLYLIGLAVTSCVGNSL